MASRKGCPNRNKKFLLSRLQDMYGEDFNPVLRMAEQASRLHKIAQESVVVSDIKASIDAWDKIASYVEPKLKMIDIGLSDEDADSGISKIKRVVVELGPKFNPS